MVLAFFLFLISIGLYIYAPPFYSLEFNLVIVLCFLFAVFFNIKKTLFNGNFFNFHILFAVSFLFVNFIYPVFVFPIDPEYFPVFKRSFNYDIISRASALALVGYSSYFIGVSVVKTKSNFIFNRIHFSFFQKSFALLLSCLFCLMLILGGSKLFTGIFGATQNIPPGLLTIFQVVAGLSLILLFYSRKGSIISILKKYNKLSLFVLILFLFLFLLTGDRGPIIQIFLIGVGAYSFYSNPISFKKLVIIFFSGAFALTFIAYARSSSQYVNSSFMERGIENFQVQNFFDIGMDLIVNNRNLYVGLEYAQKNGFSYGESFFPKIFAPIPLLPTYITKEIYDKEPGELSTATKITNAGDANYGLGTNMIADQYMEFGFLGVILFMFLLGYLVQRSFAGAQQNNIYATIIYFFLLAFSIYLPRASVLEPTRHIVWAVMIFAFFSFNFQKSSVTR